jgi:hypothetical protein
METNKNIKIIVEFDPTSQHDTNIIKFIDDELAKMKSIKVDAAPLKKSDILRMLISEPTKVHEKKVKDAFLATFSEADKLNAIYKSYIKNREVDIDLADFSLNHLGNIKEKDRKIFIDNFLT